MNKKKSLNLIELLIQVGFLILLFTYEGMLLIDDIDFTWAQDVDLELGNYTFFNSAMITENYFPLILIGIMIVNAIICLVSVISQNENRDGIVHTILAILICIFSAIYLTSIAAPTGYDIIIATPLKMIGIICALIIAILAVVKRSKYVVAEDKTTPVINNINVDTSNADELKKYKDLLDSGIITQEEFDQKKKQLLDL